ncbi:MAG: CRISPR-associated protein Cas4 [Thermoproteales archaeon]|nr:CRISPR-associated protein Cas4 [Thermoproteales archaeon]
MSYTSKTLTATDVKHYAYCPVIVYITHVLGIWETETEYMQIGKEQHEEKIIAPIIAKYKPKKVLKTPFLNCPRESLSGTPDYILIARYGYGIIVEVKWAEPAKRGIKYDHKLQLGTYAILTECKLGLYSKIGVIYYLRPKPKLYEIPITETLIKQAKKAIKNIKNIVSSGTPPEIRISPRRCSGCNYRRYCPHTPPT